MKFEPQKEHAWLTKLVGSWTYETEWSMGPGKPKEKVSGAETVRSLGGLWIVLEGRSKMPDGTPNETLMSVGYDPQKKKFVGTFIGSMMAELWIYEGSLDASGKILDLHSSGPSMKGDGSMAEYIDTIEIVSDNERIFRSRAKNEDGSFTEFMRTTYRRAG